MALMAGHSSNPHGDCRMNAPDKLQQLLTLTREPFPQSRKVYVPGAQPGVQVPMRGIAVTLEVLPSLTWPYL
jgi:hypothetical protein